MRTLRRLCAMLGDGMNIYNGKSKGNKKIEIIQVMRGIAALGIVYFHTEYGPYKSANWGVDFFFILSGFFLMVSTELNEGGVKYWKNKLIRLCPMYYIMTIVVAIGYLALPTAFHSKVVNAETVVKSFLFIPCYASDGKIFPVYSLGWTLNLEMFYYLLFFVAMKINHKHRGSIAASTVVILLLLGQLLHSENACFQFWTQTQLINFVVGIGLYGLMRGIDRIEMKRGTATTGIIVSIFLLFSGKYVLGIYFSVLWNTLWGGVLLFFCLPLKNVSVNPFLKTLGDMSFYIYMTHCLLVRTACRVLIDNTKLSAQNTLTVIAVIVIAVVFSWLVYQIFEKWFIQTILRRTLK